MPTLRRQLERQERISTIYDKLSNTYDATFQTPLALAENRIIFNQLDKLYREGDQVLDLGCGTGLVLEYLPIPAGEYTGIDISAGMLQRAQFKFPHHTFLHADMQSLLTVASSSQDLVVSTFCSFSYVASPLMALKEIARVLRPGGRLFMTVASKRYPKRPSYILNRHELAAPMTLMTARELQDLATDHALLRDVKIQGFHAITEQLITQANINVYKAILKAEKLIIGNFFPEACYYHILTAHK